MFHPVKCKLFHKSECRFSLDSREPKILSYGNSDTSPDRYERIFLFVGVWPKCR